MKRFFGDRQFYKHLLALMLPMMIQNGITNFVNMLDNVMVGRVGTVEMTAVAIANQLIFVFNLCIFGAVSGAGIFSAQFYGKGDHDGVRATFRFKLLFCLALCGVGIALFWFCGDDLIQLYLRGEGSVEDTAAALQYARDYLRVMLIGLVPYTIVQCYSSTLREIGQPILPMSAGIIAVIVNLVFNYFLIFGQFGFPRLGVVGAAIATVLSRFVECLVIAVWTRCVSKKAPFIIGAFRSFRVPFSLIRSIMIHGLPLMVNEALWASGIAILNQCYSIRGFDVVAANNISQTFFNVFSVAFMSAGVAIGILLGQTLGAGNTDQAKDDTPKLIAFSVMVSVVVGTVYFVAAIVIPQFYNTTDTVRMLATALMQITALAMPIDAFAHASYFTLRSGGKTFITFLFDSGFVWCVSVPVAFVLSRFTEIDITPLYAICQFINLIKCGLGYYFVKKGTWIRNLVSVSK